MKICLFLIFATLTLVYCSTTTYTGFVSDISMEKHNCFQCIPCTNDNDNGIATDNEDCSKCIFVNVCLAYPYPHHIPESQRNKCKSMKKLYCLV